MHRLETGYLVNITFVSTNKPSIQNYLSYTLVHLDGLNMFKGRVLAKHGLLLSRLCYAKLISCSNNWRWNCRNIFDTKYAHFCQWSWVMVTTLTADITSFEKDVIFICHESGKKENSSESPTGFETAHRSDPLVRLVTSCTCSKVKSVLCGENLRLQVTSGFVKKWV